MASESRKSESSVQKDQRSCECGQLAAVITTPSPWEFEYKCACGRHGTISWAHSAPPPRFEAQLKLF